MKNKAWMLGCLLLGLLAFTACDDEKEIKYSKLPAAAQAFLEKHFPAGEVVRIERDKDDGKKYYDVWLEDGTELEFDNNGAWLSVDCKFSVLPEGILPEEIAKDLEGRYPDATAYQVEKELGGYELSVSGTPDAVNRTLYYSKDGKFVREEKGED